jgi:anti-sigma regulatory factor (Ser/Thr protein kinase)
VSTTPASTEHTGVAGDEVRLRIPADLRLLMLARMTGSAIASRAEFSVEDIADLHLAIDELCTSCCEGAHDDATVELAFSWTSGSVRVGCVVDGFDELAPVVALDRELLPTAELSERILAALVDHHEIGAATSGRREGFFVKSCEDKVP